MLVDIRMHLPLGTLLSLAQSTCVSVAARMMSGGRQEPAAEAHSIRVRLALSPGVRRRLSKEANIRCKTRRQRCTPPAWTPFSSKFQISSALMPYLIISAKSFSRKREISSGLLAEARELSRASDQVAFNALCLSRKRGTQLTPTLRRGGSGRHSADGRHWRSPVPLA